MVLPKCINAKSQPNNPKRTQTAPPNRPKNTSDRPQLVEKSIPSKSQPPVRQKSSGAQSGCVTKKSADSSTFNEKSFKVLLSIHNNVKELRSEVNDLKSSSAQTSAKLVGLEDKLDTFVPILDTLPGIGLELKRLGNLINVMFVTFFFY